MLCRPGEGLALLSPGGRLGEGALPIAQPVQQPSPQAVPALGGHRLKQGCITVYGALPVPMRNGREEPGKPLASGLLKQGAVGGDTSELGVKMFHMDRFFPFNSNHQILSKKNRMCPHCSRSPEKCQESGA